MDHPIIYILYFLNVASLIAAAFISFRRRQKKHLAIIRYNLFYSVCGLFFLMPLDFHLNIPYRQEIRNAGFNLDVLFNLSFLLFFVRSVLIRSNFRNVILIMHTLFLIICLYFWLGPPRTFTVFTPTLYGLANVFITLPCFLYFYELFRSEFDTNYKRNDIFYIVCAIFLTYGITMPFFFGFKTLYSVSPGLLMVLNAVDLVIFTLYYGVIVRAFMMSPGNAVNVGSDNITSV